MQFSRATLAILASALNVAAIPLEAAADAAAVANSAYILSRMGMTINHFPNITTAKASREYKSSSPQNPSFLLCNNHNNTAVAVVGEINFNNGKRHRTWMFDPEFMYHSSLMIQLGNCTLVGNVTSDAGDHDYNGALRGYLGCNSNGSDCEGIDNVITKVEFASNVQGKKGMWGINLSLVDGYNGDINMTAGKGKDIKSFACHITPEMLRNSCPGTHLIDKEGGNHPSCKSDCSAFGDPKYCCTGAYAAHGVCQPSNSHLENLCGDGGAYIWPFDDAKYTEVKMDKALEVVFGPNKIEENDEKKVNEKKKKGKSVQKAPILEYLAPSPQ